MSFSDQLMPAEAIREIRSRGCTTPGVAELIVKYHGATHVLANLDRVAELGNEVAASDTAEGHEMRMRLQEAADAVGVAASDVLTSSKPAETQPDTSGDATTAAGNSAAPSESAASESTGSQGEGQAQGS